MAADQLNVMQKMLEELNALAEKEEGRVEHYETRIQNIAIGRLVWVRLFFFSISQISPNPSLLLHCNHWWVVFTLTCFCSFLYMLLFLHNSLMLCQADRKLHAIDRQKIEVRHQIWMLGSTGGAQLNIMDAGHSSSIVETRKVYIYTISSALVGLAALELYASNFLICHDNNS